MRENRLRSIWKSGGAAVNGWLAIPASFAAETMAHQGWDTLTIDLQHGVVDYQAMVTMLQAISTTPTVPVVRVPWLEPGILMKTLDAGAYAVICPMVNTREDAQRLVSYTHYAPRGTRSFGPVRANLYGGADYFEHANDTIVTFAMIETAQALDNLDAILSVEGLDAVYIGPVGPVDLARLQARLRRPRAEGRAGDRAHPGARQGAQRRRRHPQRHARGGARPHRQGLPVRDRGLRRAHPRGRLAGDPEEDARDEVMARHPSCGSIRGLGALLVSVLGGSSITGSHSAGWPGADVQKARSGRPMERLLTLTQGTPSAAPAPILQTVIGT